MALRNFEVSATGVVAEKANNLTTLAATVDTNIATAKTANQAGGANATVQTEIDAITTAMNAVDAAIPVGGVVLILDTALVTNVNQLRKLLDLAVNNIASSSLLPLA